MASGGQINIGETDGDLTISSSARRIQSEKDIAQYKLSLAYNNLTSFIDLLCEHIFGTGNRNLNHKYSPQCDVFKKCGDFLDLLGKSCDETDLKIGQGPSAVRFGHVAFRDWFDEMKCRTRSFVNQELAPNVDPIFQGELYTYLTESFGNRMRIDYGTGHELNFIIFSMGLSNLVLDINDQENVNSNELKIFPEKLRNFVSNHGWDLLWLFCHKYLRLCRRVQAKFRLEPAGSRGVYNMDDYQYLPFLFGASQLVGQKYISTSSFYQPEQVDDYKDDFVFFEAVGFILNNKRGPFNEHSYTLWNFTGIPSWENIFRRMKSKFKDDVLHPYPIVQHLLFSRYVFVWDR